MCGRYTLKTPAEAIARQFQLLAGLELPPRFNVAPTQMAPIVRIAGEAGAREMVPMRWGLIPSWARDPSVGQRMINARCETAATKPSFRAAFKRRRCLVPADGFYEWRREGRAKQPFHITLAEGQPFAMAGLWERWGEGDEALETFTILTTEANDLLRSLHDRMPVILAAANYDLWLDPEFQGQDALQGLLGPWPSDAITMRPVNRWVNSPGHEGPQCLDPPDGAEPPGKRGKLF